MLKSKLSNKRMHNNISEKEYVLYVNELPVIRMELDRLPDFYTQEYVFDKGYDEEITTNKKSLLIFIL